MLRGFRVVTGIVSGGTVPAGLAGAGELSITGCVQGVTGAGLGGACDG